MHMLSAHAQLACSAQWHRAPVAQLVEHRAAMREVVSSTPAGPTLSQGLQIPEDEVLPL